MTFALPGAVRHGEAKRWRMLGMVASSGLVMATAAIVGAALAAVGGKLGPAIMFAAPIGLGFLVAAIFHPKLGLVLFVISLPVGGVAVPHAPGSVKVVHLAAAAAVFVVLVNNLGTRRFPFVWVPPMAWLLGICALALAATPLALDVPTAVKQDVTLAIGVALVLIIPTCCRRLDDLRPLVLLLLVVGAVMCATSFGSASQLQGAYNGAVVTNRAVGVFHQPNELGTFSGMLLFIALGVAFGARSFGERVLATLAAASAVGALGLTLSRGAWIGAVLAALLFVWLLPSARRAVAVLGIPLLILVGALGAFRTPPPQLQILTERVQSITTPAANPYDDRPAIYREAVHVIETHPWLGVGPENFVVAATKNASDTQTVAPLHAHNFLLTVAAELGLPAAFLLVCMTLSVGWRIKSARRLTDRASRGLAVGLGAALVVLVGQGLVDFTMRNPVVFTFVWSVLGMALVAVRAVDVAGADNEGGSFLAPAV